MPAPHHSANTGSSAKTAIKTEVAVVRNVYDPPAKVTGKFRTPHLLEKWPLKLRWLNLYTIRLHCTTGSHSELKPLQKSQLANVTGNNRHPWKIPMIAPKFNQLSLYQGIFLLKISWKSISSTTVILLTDGQNQPRTEFKMSMITQCLHRDNKNYSAIQKWGENNHKIAKVSNNLSLQ